MLELENISLRVGPAETPLLNAISALFPGGYFGGILGPSGCGKSTLLKVIAGLHNPSEGSIAWKERDLMQHDLTPQEIGYVPQFSIVYDLLTVEESLSTAVSLRMKTDTDQMEQRVTGILAQVGLSEIRDRLVKRLSGGQKRRLALALEIVSSPSLLLCDEVTSGLDPKAEDEIVHLLKNLSEEKGRIVLSVTHSLRHLNLYDGITVLHQGYVVYHGSPQGIEAYFQISSLEDLFPRLAEYSGAEWHELWLQNRPPKELADSSIHAASDTPVHNDIPDTWQQFTVLLKRRLRLFVRDRTQLVLHLTLLFGFPMLVVIFGWGGLPEIQNLSLTFDSNPVESLIENTQFLRQATKDGTLVSGLVMFQVILLTLMGSNNSAREIASERTIFEKEKFAGLRPSSYIASKISFLAILVVVQSVWMGLFVNTICRFPGDLPGQLAVLILTNGAMTFVCLGLSGLLKTPEQASLASIYLVGFQLPLSGAVLALPEFISKVTQPFIASYWGWSGFLQTMRETRLYDVVTTVTQTDLSVLALTYWALACHILFGIFLAYMGSKHSRWE